MHLHKRVRFSEAVFRNFNSPDSYAAPFFKLKLAIRRFFASGIPLASPGAEAPDYGNDRIPQQISTILQLYLYNIARKEPKVKSKNTQKVIK